MEPQKPRERLTVWHLLAGALSAFFYGLISWVTGDDLAEAALHAAIFGALMAVIMPIAFALDARRRARRARRSGTE
jgi:hypothetical protein